MRTSERNRNASNLLTIVALATLLAGAGVRIVYAQTGGIMGPITPVAPAYCLGGSPGCIDCAAIPVPAPPGSPTAGCPWIIPSIGGRWGMGPCQSSPGPATCSQTMWDCGAAANCATGFATGNPCYNGPWCR